ncbi:MAG: hypothetical protein AB1861_01090 [Cyanobacteriota bacterium]
MSEFLLKVNLLHYAAGFRYWRAVGLLGNWSQRELFGESLTKARLRELEVLLGTLPESYNQAIVWKSALKRAVK